MKPTDLVRHSVVEADSSGCIRLLCFMVIVGFAATVASAGDATAKGRRAEVKPAVASRLGAKLVSPASAEKQTKQLLTGSHIPVSINRVGRGMDLPYPLYVIDRKAIEQSGANSLVDALRRCPVAR